MSNLTFLFFGAFLLLLFLIGLNEFIKRNFVGKYLLCRRAKSWPRALVRVTEVRTRGIVYSSDYDPPDKGYIVAATYQYEANGREYQGDCINPFYDAWGESDQADAQRLCAALESGPVFCRYNPDRPEQSLLITRYKGEWQGRTTQSLLLMLMCVWMFLMIASFFHDHDDPYRDWIQYAPSSQHP